MVERCAAKSPQGELIEAYPEQSEEVSPVLAGQARETKVPTV